MKIKSNAEIPVYFFNRLKIENNLIENKFESLINFKSFLILNPYIFFNN